jgi:hypothetical protein
MSTELESAIHVDGSTKIPKFEMSSSKVFTGLSGTIMDDYTRYYNELINDYKIGVLVYAGEMDILTGPATLEEGVRGIDLPDKEAFWAQARKIYYVKNETSADYITGGYYRTSENFSWLSVPKAGHFVPNWTNNYAVSY